MKSIKRTFEGDDYYELNSLAYAKGYDRFFLCFYALPRHHYNLLSQLRRKAYTFSDRLEEDLRKEEENNETNLYWTLRMKVTPLLDSLQEDFTKEGKDEIN